MRPLHTYRIETDRLVIRCYNPADAAMLLESITASREHLLPWMPWARNEPSTLEAKISFLREARANYDLGKDGMVGIFNKEETALIGSAGFHDRVKGNGIELGYWVDIRHTGKGYITEAIAAMTKVSFEIEGYDRVEIHCDPNNLPSANIPLKLGYTHEGTLRKRLGILEDLRGEMIWSLFKEDYEGSELKQFPLRAYDVMGRLLPNVI